jgi:hypothetical protein
MTPLKPGCEVVQSDDVLPKIEQRSCKVRADETRAAGHQPAQRLFTKPVARFGERVPSAFANRCHSRHTDIPCERSDSASA